MLKSLANFILKVTWSLFSLAMYSLLAILLVQVFTNIIFQILIPIGLGAVWAWIMYDAWINE